ncbi:mitochondrial amino-acid acetyltransferase [Talaromyces proteolyticus]|uniref:Amino-acid acetyltransferase, mitochondrial n=1 Tax=Talaromyces proteolyticus TaxID=1131652 RepID=A0AAD4KLT9_9EURO|nr:mitochondrial amino-acid acetyltransferase [Talaromyces proteolyticus]KAH8691437.1 mitochondrial amino-acid acetyltransferase [Talaromyces proteolyticus]
MSSQPPKRSLFRARDCIFYQSSQVRLSCSSCPARPYHTSSQQRDWKLGWTDKESLNAGRHRAREKLADKESNLMILHSVNIELTSLLFLLSSATTKREARSYLSRFPSVLRKKPPPVQHKHNVKPPVEPEKPGVNLGTFYGVTRSVMDAPVFRQVDTPEVERTLSLDETLHVALVKLNAPQSLDDETIKGVALTLSQLMRLGMASCVVIDPGPVQNETAWKKMASEQADRLSAAIDRCDGGKSRRLDSALVMKDSRSTLPKVISRQVLLKPLRQNHTVLITPVVYSESTCKAFLVPANDVILALTREFAGLEREHDPDEDPVITAQKFSVLQKEVSVDRLIVLDPLGGIPAFRGTQQGHVFINMEQEFKDIEDELTGAMSLRNGVITATNGLTADSAIANNNPISKFFASEVASLPSQPDQRKARTESINSPLNGHLENLRLLQQSLAMLPPSTSGIIATPKDVANSANPQPQETLSVSRVGTRRQRNPLIHNLLTDKPLHSSSLPSSRLGSNKVPNGQIIPPVVQSTFVKRGMPLTILPDPRVSPWTPENHVKGTSSISLGDPRIDLPRLVHLIEDSFNRKLDIQDYLNRINGRIAGLIIAGEYEGGAILTWETPPDIPESDRNNPKNISRLVPYLDKFAVLKRSQGAGGVADIVFNAMVRSCLPQGVCWRSRVDNPVNKWYFERSRGTWKLHESNWAMFWTTPGVPEDGPLKFKDYEAVCRSIQPSWADKKSVVD